MYMSCVLLSNVLLIKTMPKYIIKKLIKSDDQTPHITSIFAIPPARRKNKNQTILLIIYNIFKCNVVMLLTCIPKPAAMFEMAVANANDLTHKSKQHNNNLRTDDIHLVRKYNAFCSLLLLPCFQPCHLTAVFVRHGFRTSCTLRVRTFFQQRICLQFRSYKLFSLSTTFPN